MARARIEYLDGLRGIAALAVMLQHTVETIIVTDRSAVMGLRPEFLDMFNAGRFGVALFFLFSGFVIPFSFRPPRPIHSFVISRFFRLYPAYWLSLGLALVIFRFLTDQTYPPLRIIANITMVQSVFGQHDVIGVYWTLFIELAFYGLCAGLFALHLLSDWRTLIAAIFIGLGLSVAIAALAIVGAKHLPANIPLNLALMFLGTLMRQAWLERNPMSRRWLVPMIVLWAIIMPVVQFMTPGQPDIMPITPISFCTAYWVALGVFVATARLNWTPGRIFIRAGAISYSIYLFHSICIEATAHLVSPGQPWRDVVFAGLVVITTITVATLVYILIERPGIAIGHALAMTERRRPTVQPALRGKQSTP